MIVVVGEALVDVVVSPDGEREEKVGGSPMNVAVGLGRLDVPALLLTQVGADERGRAITDHVASSGAEVETSPTDDGRTSTATAHLDASGSATYDFDLTWSLPRRELPPCDALHVGSLGAALAPGRDAVLDLVSQAWDRDVFVSFDPNVRPAFLTDRDQAWRDVVETARRATLVKMSDEDLEHLRPGVPADDVAAELLEGEGTGLVILTRGERGATAWSREARAEVAAPRITTVDTVGAGDSFMAAALAVCWDDGALGHRPGVGLASDVPAMERLLTGAVTAAAITCSRRGANPPTREELPTSWPG